MDNIKLSSTELLDTSKDGSIISKLQDEVFNFVKENPVETMVGVAATMAAGTAGIFKLASREAAQIASANLEGSGLKASTEGLLAGTDSIGKVIRLGADDAGKITEVRVGDKLDLMVPYGNIRPFPGFSTDQNQVLQLLSAGFGPDGTNTVRATYRVVAPGEDAVHVLLPGRRFNFPIKAM